MGSALRSRAAAVGAGAKCAPSLTASEASADIEHELKYRVTPEAVTSRSVYEAAAWSVHNRLVEAVNATNEYWRKKDVKMVYYLSAEFLMGRTFTNAVHNLGLEETYAKALKDYGATLESVASEETDAALGNGGLGRLAACFLDSMATLDLPGWGYGIRYRYGMFKQLIREGQQQEVPDFWLEGGNPWEVRRPERRFRVSFGGRACDASKKGSGAWRPDGGVLAEAVDVPIPGYRTPTCGTLRLWDALPLSEFDLSAFNDGRPEVASEEARLASDITAVLYPNDATPYGRELRLKQQYFFVSASLQDALERFVSRHGSDNWDLLPERACFQLNDTHPTVAVAELMRLLVDEHGLGWERAWALTQASLAYTNHTVMPEALEKWPVEVFAKLLPRHWAIVQRIDREWLASVEDRVREGVRAGGAGQEAGPGGEAGVEDMDDAEDEAEAAVARELSRYAIVGNSPWDSSQRQINMAHLAVVGSKAVNGVAAIHSDIIKQDLFPHFNALFPERFQNKTNGVTLRRWLAYCNPELAALLTKALGSDAWVRDAAHLRKLAPLADDPAFCAQWRTVKRARKQALAAHVERTTGVALSVDAMFDVQVKRIHEYKRQLLNLLSAIDRYRRIKAASPSERADMVARAVLIGGKAASAYVAAKAIVRLACAVGEVVNADPEVGDLLKVVFLPNYRVTEAEVIIPGADISQHISTAGTEASGTSNMKFALNGSLIIGTLDGANVEIAEATGAENLFIFGARAEEVPRLRQERREYEPSDPRWRQALDAIRAGEFGSPEAFEGLVAAVDDMSRGNDWFLLAPDFEDYLRAQDEVDACWKDQEEWTRRSILYTACNGFFSSDRTIDQYAREIWDVQPARPQ